MPAPRGPSPLLRLQADEKLIELTRKGHHAAFETLFARYQSRLLGFCRHMLGSREDAEDVLQEVFAAAFNAILADDRAINVRPWLYRIARNRSLNHLRRTSAIGVDSMDIHYADHGLSTGERVIGRENFRQLINDVGRLPESQRTALLLREIDALSYDQIAHAMETTVPSVKSLLVRARVSLAEAAEARKLSCEEVRHELGEVAEGLVKISPPARRHVRECDRCRFFRKQLKETNLALAAIMPIGPLLLLKRVLFAKLSSAGTAHVATAGSATAGSATAGAVGTSGAMGTTGAASTLLGAGAAGGSGAAGGLVTVGASAIATKAVAGLAAAALVTAGAVEANHAVTSHPRPNASAGYTARPTDQPQIVRSTPQPLSTGVAQARPLHGGVQGQATKGRHPGKRAAADMPPGQLTTATSIATKAPDAKTVTPAVTEVTTETTQLPTTTSTSTTTTSSPASPPEEAAPRAEEPTEGVTSSPATTPSEEPPPPEATSPPAPEGPPAAEGQPPAPTPPASEAPPAQAQTP